VIASRDQLLQMHPILAPRYQDWDFRMVKAGIGYRITSIARFYKEQIALYAQGRELSKTLNLYRTAAKLQPLTKVYANNSFYSLSEYDRYVHVCPGKNIFVVTWTLDSPHVVNLDDNIVDNNWSRAFDIIILDSKGKGVWDLKTNANANQIPDYREAADLGVQSGLVVGANFKKKDGTPNPDYPHYEVKVANVLRI
jgi:hypothetical protein